MSHILNLFFAKHSFRRKKLNRNPQILAHCSHNVLDYHSASTFASFRHVGLRDGIVTATFVIHIKNP